MESQTLKRYLAYSLLVASFTLSPASAKPQKREVLPPPMNDEPIVKLAALRKPVALTLVSTNPRNASDADSTAAQLAARTQTNNERDRRILAITPTTPLQVSGRMAGKLHIVITFLETKPFYSRGVSPDQFIKRALAQMEPAPIPNWLKTYLLRVYEYHTKGVSADVVYATDDGRAFSELYNAAAGTYKAGMTKEEFERQLIPGTTPGYGDPQGRKPWWVNCVRKLADYIDDHWKE